MSIGGIGLPVPNKKPTKKCDRCGLQFPEEEEQCSHCHELSEIELHQLKNKIEEENDAQVFLGKKFFVIAVIIIVLLVFGFG